MPALELPAKIQFKITGPSLGRKPKRDSSRSGFAAGLLAGAALVLLYLHLVAEPKLQVSSETVEFAPVSIASITASQQIVVKNVGGAVLHVGDVEVTGSAAAEYTVSSGCTNAAVPPQQSCVVDISLKPSTAGERTSDLIIPNDSDDKTTTVHLTGIGIVMLGPQVTAEPPSLSFQQPANASVIRTLLLHSSGDEAAKVLSINVSGDATFSAGQNCANTDIQVGTTCQMDVTFAPSQAGNSNGTLQITYAGRKGDESVLVPLSAVATASELVDSSPPPPPPPPVLGKLDVSPQQVPFTFRIGDNVKPVQVIVSNIGDGPLPLNRVELTRGAEQFTIENKCADVRELSQRSNCSVWIQPNSHEAGQFAGSLLVSTRQDDQEVPLSAQVLQNTVARVVVKPPTLRIAASDKAGVLAALFNTVVSSSIVHVYNIGDASLTIDHLEFTSPYFNSAANSSGRECRAGLQIQPRQECLIQVNFRPGAPSTSAELRIFDNVVNSPQSVQLLGIAQPPKTTGTLQISGGSNFGNVTVGRSAAITAKTSYRPGQQVISLSNVGNGNLALTNIALRGDSTFQMFSRCGKGLAPNGTCSIVVTFQPIAYGERTAMLVIDNDGTTGSQTVSLRGAGVNPNVPPKERAKSPSGLQATIK